VERGEITATNPLENGPSIFSRADLDSAAACDLARVQRPTQDTPRYRTPPNKISSPQ
jgi:hypothetical protein